MARTQWKITQLRDQLTFDVSWRESADCLWLKLASFEALESAQLYIQNYLALSAVR